MAVEVTELYSNLNQLLDDICKFLTDEGTYEKLSPLARKQADELIKRSKHQLKEIEKINTECDGAYVDMDRNPENDDDGKNNIYSSVDETAVIISPVTVEPQPNLYASLPAKNLSQDFKYGSLSWKCRIILKFEKIRRIYAGVHDNWLLVYSSERDSKPLHTFYLKFYKADPIISKQNKNPPRDFELISTSDGKSYYFLALTHKDMLQWVSHINRCYENLNSSSILFEEPYDIPELLNQDKDEDEESIYNDISDTFIPMKQEEDSKPPDLPARRIFNNCLPLPKSQKIENEHISPELSPTRHRSVSEESDHSEANSFSSDEDADDEIYGVFYNETTKQKPQLPQKPKILKEKTKLLIH